jgi:hypothetical protein
MSIVLIQMASLPKGLVLRYAIETTSPPHAGAGAGAQPPLLNLNLHRSSVVIRHKLISWAMFSYLTSSRKAIPHIMAWHLVEFVIELLKIYHWLGNIRLSVTMHSSYG